MYQYPYQQFNQQYQQFNQQLPTQQQIIRVNGENGAKAYQMMPNSSALLLDETAAIIWLAQTDGAGYKTVTAYEIKPYSPPEAQSVDDLMKRIERLEAMMYEQSDTTSNGRSKKYSDEQHTEHAEKQKS